MNLRELQAQYAKLVHDAREYLDAPEKESREKTEEDENKYSAVMSEIDALKDRIKKTEEQERLEAGLSEVREEAEKPVEKEDRENVSVTATTEYRDMFNEFMRTGNMTPEFRALQVDLDISGGYAVLPEEYINQIIQERDNSVFVRKMATKYRIPKAQSLGVPALDNDPADPTWVGEIKTGSADSTMSFGKRELNPNALAQSIRVSNKLIRAGAISINDLVRQRLNYKISVVEENGFLNGTGALQPLGVFIANANGISTGRDVSTGNTTTTIEPDNLFEQKYNLKMQYRNNVAWIFHRDAVKMIAKLKDGEGRFLLSPDIKTASFDRLLTFPVYESEYAPSTFTTGLYVGILGDFSYYWIADALDASIQVVNELYAATNQTGFFSRSETDGMPVLESAFSRVKLG